jgi:hypothetical protein
MTSSDARAFLAECEQWIIFVYGKLIYNLYGAKTEEAFVKSWGIGLAIELGTGFQELVQQAGQAFFIMFLLDMLLTA